MKIGVLGWDHGEEDPDSPGLADMGRERGHETTLCSLEEVHYAPGRNDLEVWLGEYPARSFDAVISRPNLYGEWKANLYDGWLDRIERLTMISNVLDLPIFDRVDVSFPGHSKFLTAQRLAAAGLPVPPTRSATTVAEVAAAFDEWGTTVIKPSFGLRGIDVERITDPLAQEATIGTFLVRYGTLVCTPYYPTEYGEYRVNVAGETAPMVSLKLPPIGSWRCKIYEGASYELVEAPPGLLDLAFRATRVMGMTLAGLDILPTSDGLKILEVNPIPGILDMFGQGPRREVFAGVYDWVEKHVDR